MNVGPDDGTARVVVVDDETHVADLYAEYLRPEHDVEVAYGSEEALEEIHDDVDVVLLDRRMPRRSGEEVLERLRERGIDARVVLVTAVEPAFDGVEVPFDDYVTKPVDRDTVLDVVREQRLLDRYDARLDEYLQKFRKLRLLERRHSRARLRESDRYGALRTVVESLRDDLTALIEEYNLDPERRPDALDALDADANDGDATGDDGEPTDTGDGGVDWEPIGE